jgi:hypothetical protein
VDGGSVPDTLRAAAEFNGTYDEPSILGGATAADVAGKHAACVDSSTNGAPSVFYQVLLAR